MANSDHISRAAAIETVLEKPEVFPLWFCEHGDCNGGADKE